MLDSIVALAASAEPDVKWEVAVGPVAWAIVSLILGILIYKLIAGGKLKRFRAKGLEVETSSSSAAPGRARRSAEADQACADLDMTAIRKTQAVARRRADSREDVRAAQKLHIDTLEDEFFQLFAGAHPWHVDCAWGRFHRVLTSAADQNHILEFVKSGLINPDYLRAKCEAFGDRYAKLLTWPDCTLGPYDAHLSRAIESLLQGALLEFSAIAEAEDLRLKQYVEDITIGESPELRTVILAIIERTSKED